MGNEDGRRIFLTLGRAYAGAVERHLQKMPNSSFHRDGLNIFWKDGEGEIHNVFNFEDIRKPTYTIEDVFLGGGIFIFKTSDKNEVILTQTPEEHWTRVWVPTDRKNTHLVLGLLDYYGGLRSVNFEDIERMKITIGGQKVRQLCENAIYFEFNTAEPGIETKFPQEDPIVKKYSSENYGMVFSQRKLEDTNQ